MSERPRLGKEPSKRDLYLRIKAALAIDWRTIGAPFGGLSTDAERAAWKAAVDTCKHYVVKALKGEQSE